MVAPLGKDQRAGIIRRYASKLRFPQLFAVLTGLFVLDFFIVDPIPFVDEAILGVLAVLLGMWRRRHDEKEETRPPMKNVTPNRTS